MVFLDDCAFPVADEKFWRTFAAGWEPDTERIFRRYAPQGVVLDIGAWIGSTVMFALAGGAEKVIAVEPHPGSFAKLQELHDRNPLVAQRVALHNVAVSRAPGKIPMGMVDGEHDTSTSGIRGNDFLAEAITLRELIRRTGVSSLHLVKIDIEGAEAELAEDILWLATRFPCPIHLSLHMPFFRPGTDLQPLLRALQSFQAEDDRGEPLSPAELARRITCTDSHPPWGTRHGNFFELLLLPA